MATPLVCERCKGRLFKVSVKRPEKILFFNCAKCGKMVKITPPSAKEILEKNPDVVREYVKKVIRDVEDNRTAV